MSSWPRWSLEDETLALARYVRPDQVARQVPLPGPSGESRLARLRAVYEAIAKVTIGYAYDAPTDEAGRQVIRPPDQVLWAPRHATCLDLALVLAGGCLTAGLHPAVVILAPPSGRGSLHALLLVRLDHDTTPTSGAGAVWPSPPIGWLAELQRQVNGAPGKVVAVDPVGVAVSLGFTRTRGLNVSFGDAVASGARYLTGAAGWDWKVGVDIGASWRAQDVELLEAHPVSEPLRAPYRAPDTAESPLRLLRAEYELVRFQNRDELTVLREFCHRSAAGDRTGLAVITGIGGCGKTRLALELAQRLRAEGWYAGTLPKGTAGVEWLAGVVSPVLVVLDYADGRVADATALLAALRARRGPPAVVLLTARAIDGDWLASIIESLNSDAHAYRREDIALPDTHPNPGDVYHRTVTALTTTAVTPPAPPRGIRWTTLDYVLLGWIAAQGAPTLPTSSEELYDQALEHEQNYWCTVYRDNVRDRAPRRARLRKAAACLSLVAAAEPEADAVLAAVKDLRDDRRERQDVRDTLIACLRPAPGEGLALRPDPVGDHLLLRELGGDDGLLARVLDNGNGQGLQQALVTLVRAGYHDLDTATRLITSLLDADLAPWPDVLAIAATQGGAAASSLEHLASRTPTPLPLDELSAALPFSSLGLYQLALIVDQRLLDAARAAGADRAQIAELLQRLSGRASYAGDRDGALDSITQAVGHYRELATANPAAYLPNLATSLNNLSVQQAATGDRAGALDAITEAVGHHRKLATANPAAYLPDLAKSLNNLSLWQAETGDRAGALDAITEAVGHHRKLATANPAAYLPDLATSLNNLALRQAETGDRADALNSITQAVGHHLKLATANPATYLPDLATSLNNLALRQAETGDRADALDSITQAVAIRRELATANPAAYLPDLAESLNNLSNLQAETGDRADALNSITQAVAIHRELATANPATYLPDLAMSLNNLSLQQAETGDRDSALNSITQAVAIHRELATANPATYLPDLAMSLNNLALRQAETGDRDSALDSITQAVGHCRKLATANPAAYLPNLATSLNNLSNWQAETGDRTGALDSITQAVAIRHKLATTNPAAYLPDLAMSLNNLALRQAETGDRDSALDSITQAVAIRRELATTNPAAYLPNLATSLNNLSNWQAETGDRTGALDSITQAVAIRHKLATTNPAAYLPDLATSLNNLALRQTETGDRDSALNSITQAVGHYRQLATANPAVYLPTLAMSLNNLSNRQAETGDRDSALDSITQAVGHCRELATTNPATYLPDLAMSLNNLAVQQAETGDRAGALNSITQAVGHYRQLATTNPATYLPDLAMSLNNLAVQQAETGDRAGALNSITQAVGHYRQLATTNPATYLPDLAMSLNNLAVQQAETGDRAGALNSITQAVRHYRQLATTNPATYLPNLATSLNNLSDQQTETGDRAGAISTAWQAAIDAMVHPAARAELRAAWAGRLTASDQPQRAWESLRQAATEADTPLPDVQPPDRMSIILTMRARQEIRALTQYLGPPATDEIPIWASAPLPDVHLDLVNAYGQADDWPAAQAVLNDHREILTSPQFRTTLTALASLYLTNPIPGELVQLLDEIAESGIETAFALRHADHQRRALLTAWINSPTWTESLDYYRQHHSELSTADTRAILASVDDDTAHQHLAILDLTDVMPAEQVYSMLTDAGAAEDAAFEAIEQADLTRLATIATAATTALRTRPSTWALLSAVLLLAADQPDPAYEITRQLAEQASPLQRRAHTIRLRALRTHHPDLPGLDELIAIINPESAAS